MQDRNQIETVAREVAAISIQRIEAEFGALYSPCAIEIADVTSDAQPQGATVILCGVGSAQANSCTGGVITVGRDATTIRPLLEIKNPDKDFLLGMYHHACSAENQIVEFLGHYHLIVVCLNDPIQQVIDQFMTAKDSTIPIAQKPKPKMGTETIYTRLRNELVHMRHTAAGDIVTPENIKGEVEMWLPGLRRLARAAIKHVHP